jgi:hypothetical protein
MDETAAGVAGGHQDHIGTAVEVGTKKVFLWAVDWPGWCRSGKTELAASDALIAHAERYDAVIARAGYAPLHASAPDLDLVDRADGGAGTDFGVPGEIVASDRRPTDAAEAGRQVRIVSAAWAALDDIVAGAPAQLRKGPRGGGRDRDKVFAHVIEAEQAYAQVMGIKRPGVDPTDRAAIDDLRAAMAAVLREPSDGSPIADRKWPPRYAARRIAWHVLDHAWEIEDRSAA